LPIGQFLNRAAHKISPLLPANDSRIEQFDAIQDQSDEQLVGRGNFENFHSYGNACIYEETDDAFEAIKAAALIAGPKDGVGVLQENLAGLQRSIQLPGSDYVDQSKQQVNQETLAFLPGITGLNGDRFGLVLVGLTSGSSKMTQTVTCSMLVG